LSGPEGVAAAFADAFSVLAFSVLVFSVLVFSALVFSALEAVEVFFSGEADGLEEVSAFFVSEEVAAGVSSALGDGLASRNDDGAWMVAEVGSSLEGDGVGVSSCARSELARLNAIMANSDVIDFM
jgi:hypothetical protein